MKTDSQLSSPLSTLNLPSSRLALGVMVGAHLFALLSSLACVSHKGAPVSELQNDDFVTPQKISHQHTIHGDVREDEYFWMRNRDSEPVLKYLKSENERYKTAVKPIQGVIDTLFKEMRSRIKEDDSSVPYFRSGFWYYSRFETGKEYAIHGRKKGSQMAQEEVLLDENLLAKGQDYFDLGSAKVSPDQAFLAYTVDTVGRRFFKLKIKDLNSGQNISASVADIADDFVWSQDGKNIYFTKQDPTTLRHYQVYELNLASGTTRLAYEETDNTYSVGLGTNKENSRIWLAIYKTDSTEWRYLQQQTSPPGSTEAPDTLIWKVFAPREPKHEYYIDDAIDQIYIKTNWQAPNNRLMKATIGSSSKNDWKEVVAHRNDALLEDVDVYRNHVVIQSRVAGQAQFSVLNRQTETLRQVTLQTGAAFEANLSSLPDFSSTAFRFTYESLSQPATTFEETFDGSTRSTLKTKQVPGYKAEDFESVRLWAKAHDGTLVPISLLQRKGAPANGSGPLLLYAYGSYGYSMTPSFRSTVMSLLNRGFRFAVAHIRGGKEMGRHWYEQGRLQNKMNTFTDFIACSEHLIREGYVAPNRLHANGGSAGGLLMGGIANMRPDLYRSIIADVPFVDVLTTMLDETIPLTTSEYSEWGDPRKPEDYFYMKRYSPYDNVKAQAYPHMFVTTGYHDSQVQYWEPAKWVARLRDRKTDQNLLLMETDFETGHSGPSGRFQSLKKSAEAYGFILLTEGIYQ